MVLIFVAERREERRERENLLRSDELWRGEKERRQLVDLFYASSTLCQRCSSFCTEEEKRGGELTHQTSFRRDLRYET